MGLPGLVLLGVESFRSRIRNPSALGLDGVIAQQPNLRVVRPEWRAAARRAVHAAGLMPRLPRVVRYPYHDLVDRAMHDPRTASDARHYSTVCTGWDNTPRRRRGAVVITGSTPEAYRSWLEQTLTVSKAPLVFINAWNEWAEGAHLEPDRIHGDAYLDATLNAVNSARRRTQ